MNRLPVPSFSVCFFRKKPAFAVFFLLVFSLFFSRMLPAAEPAPEFSVIAPLASKSLLLAGCLTNGRAVVVGERGHILYSDDQGETWTQARVQTIATLTGVYFHNKDLGWAVGHDAVILRTTDGGKNWLRVYSAPEEERPLLDVWFKDANNGFAVGAYNFFLTTQDGGLNWSDERISEDDWHLNQIRKSDNGKLYLAGEAGTVYRSEDEGETWSTLPSPYKGSFFGILPLGGDAVLVFGLRGNLFRSEDAGESWQEMDTHTTAMLNYGLKLKDGRIFIVGLGGTVLVSNDGGNRFSLLQQPDRRGILSALPIDNNNLLLVGEGGVKKLSIADKE